RFKAAIRDGDGFLLFGPKGSGKTRAALQLAWIGHDVANRINYLNITMERATDGQNFEKVMHGPGFVYIDDGERWAQEHLKFMKRARADPSAPQHATLWLDEAALSLFRAGQTLLSP